MKGFFLLSFSLVVFLNAVESPYDALKEILPFDNQGWYENAVPLKKIIKERDVKVVVELGSWLGTSTRHIASILPKDGIVYAIDHWEGSLEHRKFCPEVLPILYKQFLSNVIHAKLTDKIFPIKMSTWDAASKLQELDVKPDLIYIDAAHDEASVYLDLFTYYPFVQGHGILCGDDWNWPEKEAVRNAVSRFAKENNLKVVVDDNDLFWALYER